jgi:hypothetical protein
VLLWRLEQRHRPQHVFVNPRLDRLMASHKKSLLPPDASLKIARADAIDAYGGLEIALTRLFAQVLGTKPDLAGIVLFRVGNARARNKMIEHLIKRKHGAKYNLYWNSVLKFIGQLDQRRNEIVHWHMMIQPNFNRTGRLTSATATLRPPNLWDRRRTKESLSGRDLREFASRCDFADAAVWSFVFYGQGRHGNRKLRATWQDIFRQPLTYPPPDNHPIRQRWPKRVVLLQPSHQ